MSKLNTINKNVNNDNDWWSLCYFGRVSKPNYMWDWTCIMVQWIVCNMMHIKINEVSMIILINWDGGLY